MESSERAFYYPIDEVPMTRESASEGDSDLLQKGMSSIDLPDNWPALNTVLMDDEDRLWVATIVEDFDVYEWWVFEKSGEVITRFEWPRDKSIEEVKNGYIYTRETDERGVETIVKYEIKMDEG